MKDLGEMTRWERSTGKRCERDICKKGIKERQDGNKK
jgi:hypothetical protein